MLNEYRIKVGDITLSFSITGSGLEARGGGELKGFAMEGVNIFLMGKR